MVRRVRFSPDDPADFDPRDRRDSFDDLDDLVIDAVAPGDAPRPEGPAETSPDVSAEPPRRRNAADDRRRHLADADWLSDPAA